MTALPDFKRDFPFACGNCGTRFTTKGEKRRHKLSGCEFSTAAGDFDHSNEDDRCPPQHLYADMRRHITPEVKAQADAEWAAMDWRGKLPDGWTWREQG